MKPTSMYNTKKPKPKTKPSDNLISVQEGSKHVTMKVNGKHVTLPSPSYVSALEKKIDKLEDDMQHKNNQIRFLQNNIEKLQRQISGILKG